MDDLKPQHQQFVVKVWKVNKTSSFLYIGHGFLKRKKPFGFSMYMVVIILFIVLIIGLF